MEIVTEVVTVTTTGAAGSATGSGNTKAVNGYLLDIYFDFSGSAPATTDTTVAYAPTSGGGTILTLTNTVTDALHAPRKQASDNAGAAIGGVYDCYPVSGALTISLAQCDALAAALVAYVRFLRIA